MCCVCVQYSVKNMMLAKQYAHTFTFLVPFVIEEFNASLEHVQAGSCWAVANVEAPLCEYIISEPSYYSGTVFDF